MTFRAKLSAIVGTSSLALILLMIAGSIVAKRVDEQLTTIQAYYLPRVELGPRLEAQFEHLRRTFQDSVASRDAEALARTREIKESLLGALDEAQGSVDPGQVAALRRALDAYYTAAYDISRRLIAGETGETLVSAMEDMQARHAKVVDLLKRATSFDKRDLADAFAATMRTEVSARRIRLVIEVVCMVLVLLLSRWLSRGVLRSLADLAAGFERFGRGDFGQPIRITTRDELAHVAERANAMAERLGRLSVERDRADWIKAGLAGLTEEARGELEPADLANRATRFVAQHLEAPAAALYYLEGERTLEVLGQYALAGSGASQAVPRFRLGEGLVGQAALGQEISIVSDPPASYLRIRSGLGEAPPRVIALLPLVHSGKVTGVLELALFKPWSELASELLLTIREALTIAIEVARVRRATRELLAETQRQAHRLATQEEELRSTNEQLQNQQEELRQSNEELAQQAEELEIQRRTLEQKNLELDDARRRTEHKAAELTTVSAYKSQFLTNMSHELRTPLNSMLLLSNLLGENEGKNLTAKQVEFCKTIHAAGKDLLALINQVLDLAKVESGKQEIRIAKVRLGELVERVEQVFGPMARDKGLGFSAEMSAELPEVISTDRQRVEQILNNLLGNAIKFTQKGRVALRIAKPQPGLPIERPDLRADRAVALVVSDTGVGIAPEHRERIFAPFEQVESTSDRRYGGTGLGLTIALELAALLGGELTLESTPGKGSTFTCLLPYDGPPRGADAKPPIRKSPSLIARSVPIAPPPTSSPSPSPSGEAFLLIIEDDARFAEGLSEIIQSQGLACRIVSEGRAGLRLAKETRPRGIILDVKLPDLDGWKVMEELRKDPKTADIPVHFITAVDAAERGIAMGAIGYLTKPATQQELIGALDALVPKASERSPRVLVVEDDLHMGESVVQQLAYEHIEAVRVSSAHQALDALGEGHFDCIVLDLSLSDMDGLELLRSLEERGGGKMPSVVVYTARALSKAEAGRLEAYAEAVVLKEGHSAERLLSEIRLFVRRLREGLPPRRQSPTRVHPAEVHLEKKKILIVDDDMRTVYALSALLRAKGAQVLVGDTGRAGLDVLAQHADLDAILMDIMMPEMDGYEAMRRIRQQEAFRQIPIIALTAKAMKGDLEKCIAAGASDYLPKPIDSDRLIALLSDQLSKKPSHAS